MNILCVPVGEAVHPLAEVAGPSSDASAQQGSCQRGDETWFFGSFRFYLQRPLATAQPTVDWGPLLRHDQAAFMITMKTKYALKALCRLARAPVGVPVLIAEIAADEGIPRKFLELILAELKQHGVLQSRKGRGGGYSLARRPETISVASVLRVLDGPIAPVPCLSRTAYQRCAECRDEASCGVRLVLREAHAASVRVLESTTVADMLARVDSAAIGHATLKYSI